MVDKCKLEFFVLNEDINAKKIISCNIFNNIRVYESTINEVKKYLKSSKKYKCTTSKDIELYGFEAFCYKLSRIIMYEEWSRCEYEIYVSGKYTDSTKLDCYTQAFPNIEIIAREVIY